MTSLAFVVWGKVYDKLFNNIITTNSLYQISVNIHTYTTLPLFASLRYQYVQDGIRAVALLFRIQTNTVLTEDFSKVLFRNIIWVHKDVWYRDISF